MVMEYQYYQEVASVTSFFVRKEIHFAKSARQVHVLVYMGAFESVFGKWMFLCPEQCSQLRSLLQLVEVEI